MSASLNEIFVENVAGASRDLLTYDPVPLFLVQEHVVDDVGRRPDKAGKERIMAENRAAPKVFISYSWTSDEHQAWVQELAERLVADGVHVILDLWDLKEGHDKYAFMERMVTDTEISRVLLILDKKYCEKADLREGGVGSESQIISPEIYNKVAQEKFIPIVAQRGTSGEAFMPTFMKSRIYIDLSSKNQFAKNYEVLLRNIFQRPARQRPAIGTPPAFLDEANPVSPASRFRLEEFINAIEDGRREANGHLRRFLQECLTALGVFRIVARPAEPLDDVVIKHIHDMTPIRDQVLRAFDAVCTYSEDANLYREFCAFLESSLAFLHPTADLNSWQDTWFDHYAFFLRELLLYVVALAIRHERYGQLNGMLQTEFCFAGPHENVCGGFTLFARPVASLDEWRKARLNLNRISVVADMLKERAPNFGIDFDALMQADVILTLKFLFSEVSGTGHAWYPDTAVFAERRFNALPLFARFEAGRASHAIGALFDTSTREAFLEKLEGPSRKHNLASWRMGHWPIPFNRLLGIAKRPN